VAPHPATSGGVERHHPARDSEVVAARVADEDLASEESGWITGVVLDLAGGAVMG
jgi:hypothetical protein